MPKHFPLLAGVGTLVFFIAVSVVLAVAPPPQSPQPSGYKGLAHNQQINGMLYGLIGPDWFQGLSNPNVTVSYAAALKTTGGTIIPDASQVAVGSTVVVTPKPSVYTDIYWFGTGHANDSPYGDWGSGGPGELTCEDKDLVGYLSETTSIYVPLRVAPASRSITTSSNLTCGAPNASGARSCVVNAPGAITVNVTFGATTGNFYYRRHATSGLLKGCRGHADVPMTLNGPTYTLQVSSITIPFTLTAIAANNPPTTPTITGPTTLTLSGGTVSGTYGFVATDPDADTIRYGIDWNMDATIDQWLPGSGYVASGNSQSTNRSWTTTGTKTFQARTYDDNNASSAWRSYSVVVSAPPQCSDGVNNSDGDSYTDYPNDPGCSSSTDTTEGPNPQCSDSSNNDPSEDALTDYPNDPGCSGPADTSESPNPPSGPVGTPSAYIEAVPDRINSKGAANTVLLSWSAQNVTSCTVTSNNGTFPTTAVTANASFQVPTSTPTATSVITSQSVYAIECSPGGAHKTLVNVDAKSLGEY